MRVNQLTSFTELPSLFPRLWKVFWMLQVGLMQTCCFAIGSATCWCLKPYRMDVPMDHSGAISRSPGESGIYFFLNTSDLSVAVCFYIAAHGHAKTHLVLFFVHRCLIECRDEYKYNVEAVELLIRNHLVNMQQYDLHLAQVQNVNSNILSWCLVQIFKESRFYFST